MDSILGNVKRKKISERLKRTDPYLRKIYSEIVEHQSNMKIKPEKMKVQKHQITKYLKRRFGGKTADKIVSTFDFPPTCNFEDYCKCIENFI